MSQTYVMRKLYFHEGMYPTLRRKLHLEETDDVQQHNLSMRALKRIVGMLVHFRDR